MDNSLTEKLKRLGMKLGSEHIAPPQSRAEEFSVSMVIPGEMVNTMFGPCYRVKKLLDREHIHGQTTLIIDGEIGLVADWAHTDRLRNQKADHIVFLDTETSGLSGGTGTFAFLVGVSQLTTEGLEFTQFLLRDPSEEEAMLTALAEYMTGIRAVVTYNGKAFDIPLLNNRYILHGLSSPFKDIDHIDLLPMARKIWKKKLASRRLSNVEAEILRVERTMDEVPGYLVPQVYFDYLKSGDARPLVGVLYHNEMDVLSLTTLLQHFMNAFSKPKLDATDAPEDLYPVIDLLMDLGHEQEAIKLFERIFHPDAGSQNDDWETLEKISYHFKRNKNWTSAKQIWESAEKNGLEFGWFELAKYYEHQERNYQEALKHAENLRSYVNEQKLPPFTKNQRLVELQTRIDRIKVKHKALKNNLRKTGGRIFSYNLDFTRFLAVSSASSNLEASFPPACARFGRPPPLPPTTCAAVRAISPALMPFFTRSSLTETTMAGLSSTTVARIATPEGCLTLN